MRFDTKITEYKKLKEYVVFIEKGNIHIDKVSDSYHKICIHTVFDIMNKVGTKLELVVAEGHLNDVPTKSLYSGVVSLQ